MRRTMKYSASLCPRSALSAQMLRTGKLHPRLRGFGSAALALLPLLWPYLSEAQAPEEE